MKMNKRVNLTKTILPTDIFLTGFSECRFEETNLSRREIMFSSFEFNQFIKTNLNEAILLFPTFANNLFSQVEANNLLIIQGQQSNGLPVTKQYLQEQGLANRRVICSMEELTNALMLDEISIDLAKFFLKNVNFAFAYLTQVNEHLEKRVQLIEAESEVIKYATYENLNLLHELCFTFTKYIIRRERANGNNSTDGFSILPREHLDFLTINKPTPKPTPSPIPTQLFQTPSPQAYCAQLNRITAQYGFNWIYTKQTAALFAGLQDKDQLDKLEQIFREKNFKTKVGKVQGQERYALYVIEPNLCHLTSMQEVRKLENTL